jgi:hypothetical protein
MKCQRQLAFQPEVGLIEGFEDRGKHGRTHHLANHALVFMLRGLRKKWKQPVAYYLIHGSTNGLLLATFLEDVLDACHDAGLEVVATVCDMAANNVSALKKLGVTEKRPFFSRNNQEIAAIFDPPHLLNVPATFSLSIMLQMWSVIALLMGSDLLVLPSGTTY